MNLEVITRMRLNEPSPQRTESVPSGNGHSAHHGPAFPVSVFDSANSPARDRALEVLTSGIKDADLAAPPVVLPDFHHKHNMEMPSSIAVATSGSIRPTLSSASLNCGMALMSFDVERPADEHIVEFYRRIRERHPHPPANRPNLTSREVVRAALEGAEFAIDRWNIDPADLQRVEEGGRLSLEPFGGMDRAAAELPWLMRQMGRVRFGAIGPSNHFVELQQVEAVFDCEAARQLGVHQGQITLQYHAGGGALTGAVGALFGDRMAGSRLLKAAMTVQKPLYHFGTARSIEEARLRMHLYFSGGCPAIPSDSVEGERVRLFNVLSMNYGFAFRQAVYASLSRVAREVFGARSQLIVDSPHNSIYEEELGDRRVLVHRHNTSRAYPASRMPGHPVFARTGAPVLLPGTNKTCSYLCVPSAGAESSLYSTCHGAGSIISDFAKRGLSGPDPEGHVTLRFNYKAESPRAVAQLDNQGVDEALRILTDHDIVRPVARLRPFAVLN